MWRGVSLVSYHNPSLLLFVGPHLLLLLPNWYITIPRRILYRVYFSEIPVPISSSVLTLHGPLIVSLFDNGGNPDFPVSLSVILVRDVFFTTDHPRHQYSLRSLPRRTPRPFKD